MNSQSQAIEEGIKIALDAADTATSVVGEFGHIKADYAEARKQMANTYKLIATIVISSIIAMVIAMIVAEALNYLRHQQSVRLGANLEPDKPLSD
jgi:phosphate/sulfate permease